MAEATAVPEASLASAAPERVIALDMVRRSAVFVVPFVAVGAVGWGWAGVASVSLALALVLVNFLLGASAITWGARLGGNVMLAAVLGGYLVRLGIVAVVVFPFRHSGWFEVVPFSASLLLTHLGLLVWETRHVSASLAFPHLEPGHEFRLSWLSSRTSSSSISSSSSSSPSSISSSSSSSPSSISSSSSSSPSSPSPAPESPA